MLFFLDSEFWDPLHFILIHWELVGDGRIFGQKRFFA